MSFSLMEDKCPTTWTLEKGLFTVKPFTKRRDIMEANLRSIALSVTAVLFHHTVNKFYICLKMELDYLNSMLGGGLIIGADKYCHL